MADTVLIHHRGMPADPPVVNGITFAPHPDDPTLYVGEASIAAAQVLCHPGSPFQTEADLPPVEVTVNPELSVPSEPVAPVFDPFQGSPAGALAAIPMTEAEDPDLPTSGPGITEPVVPDNVVQANPVPSTHVDFGLDPTMLLVLREEQADLQAKQDRTPEDEARLQAISDELAFAGFAQ